MKCTVSLQGVFRGSFGSVPWSYRHQYHPGQVRGDSTESSPYWSSQVSSYSHSALQFAYLQSCSGQMGVADRDECTESLNLYSPREFVPFHQKGKQNEKEHNSRRIWVCLSRHKSPWFASEEAFDLCVVVDATSLRLQEVFLWIQLAILGCASESGGT